MACILKGRHFFFPGCMSGLSGQMGRGSVTTWLMTGAAFWIVLLLFYCYITYQMAVTP